MTVSELINQTLSKSKERDPHVIASRLRMKLDDEATEQIISRGLVMMVSEAIRLHRNADTVRISASAKKKSAHEPGPPRWQVAARHSVAGEWKFETECTAADLYTLADQYEALASANQARANHFRRLAVAVEEAGVATLGELQSRQVVAA